MSVFKELVKNLKEEGSYVYVKDVAEVLGGEVVSTRWEEGGRWHNLEYTTIKFADNKFFEVCVEEGATECQERGTISVYKVTPRRVEVIKYDRDDIITAEEWDLE